MIYSENSHIISGNVKNFNFKRSGPFEMIAEYSNPSLLPPGTPTLLGKFIVNNFPEVSEKPAKIQVISKLDVHGIFRLISVQVHENYEVEVEVEVPNEKKDETKKEPEKKPEESKPDNKPENNTQSEQPKEQPKEEPKKEEVKKEKVKKKKVKKIDVDVDSKLNSLSNNEIQQFTEVELKMLSDDKLITDTAERKNAVESYVYDFRDKLNGELSKFATEDLKTKFLKTLDETQEWLYGEGEDQTKSVYATKMEELKKIGDPIAKRKWESENRYYSYMELKKAYNEYTLAATSNDPKYDHIDAAEKQKVVDKCTSIMKEVDALMAKQESVSSYADPVITVSQLKQNKNDLDFFLLSTNFEQAKTSTKKRRA